MHQEFLITLSQLNGVGVKTIRRILDLISKELESSVEIEQLYDALHYINLPRFKPPTIEVFSQAYRASLEIINNSKILGIQIITVFDNEYPDSLRLLEDYPSVLYIKGNVNLLKDMRSIAIVGSRDVHNLLHVEFDHLLSRITELKDPCIVSGLALGTDSLAHRYALKNQIPTIAVMPCGLDKIVPSENSELAKNILAQGGLLISEYPIGTNPTKSHFLNRNRIQSGLSKEVIIMQASIKSGTMTTFKKSMEQKKKVLVFLKENLKVDEKFSGNSHMSTHPGVSVFNDAETLLEMLNLSDTRQDENQFGSQLGLF